MASFFCCNDSMALRYSVSTVPFSAFNCCNSFCSFSIPNRAVLALSEETARIPMENREISTPERTVSNTEVS